MLNINLIHTLDPSILLDISILLSIILGICVISSNNPMLSILYLIGLFIAIAGYLYYIGLGIMSLLYLLIYVGAIAILFLFILSLLDVKISELQVKSNSNDIPLVIIVSSILFYSVYWIYNNEISILDINKVLDYRLKSNYSELFNVIDSNILGSIYHNVNNLPETLFTSITTDWYNINSISELSSVGNLLYTEYSIYLILMGVILLLSIIGAIVTTTLKK